MLTPIHNAVIHVPASDAQRIKYLLMHEPDDEDECMSESISYTAQFENGFQADIKLCGVQYEDEGLNLPWAEAVLFNENGSCLCQSDAEGEFFGRWELEYNDEMYIIEVVAESE